MRKRYRVTHPAGLPGLGAEAGAEFEADDTEGDIKTLLLLEQIEEADQPKAQSSQTVVEASGAAKAKATEATAEADVDDDEEDHTGSSPKRGHNKGRYQRRDQRARED